MSAPTLVAPYRFVTATVRQIQQLGGNLRRFTFTGPDAHLMDTGGYDQRIKLVLPLPGQDAISLDTGGDWYTRWRSSPDHLRNPIRTYTVRSVRPELSEIDVDIVLHGRVGPASRWALDATVGDELLIFGPNREHGGPYGGVDFLPPAHTDLLLLAGDPTALPAIAATLEQLPAESRGVAIVEVDHASDARSLGHAPAGVDVRIVVRRYGEHGSMLIPAVQRAAAELLDRSDMTQVELEDVDVDTELLWEAPRRGLDEPARSTTHVYAWLAGEAAVIKTLRRHLVAERGMDRKSVAFMGYWRLGREENNS